MTEVKKYHIGYQPDEFELVDTYVGWTPEGFASWSDFCAQHLILDGRMASIAIVSADWRERTSLHLHLLLTSGEFPLSFFSEARSAKWSNFCIVSRPEEPEAEFIIPLH